MSKLVQSTMLIRRYFTFQAYNGHFDALNALMNFIVNMDIPDDSGEILTIKEVDKCLLSCWVSSSQYTVLKTCIKS